MPFMIADVKEYISAQYGEPFCAIMLVTRDEIDGRNQFVINDGSTGIYEQVKGMVERSKRKSGIICPNGLRASKYEKVISDAFGNAPDKTIQATTYYVG